MGQVAIMPTVFVLVDRFGQSSKTLQVGFKLSAKKVFTKAHNIW
jgi:hypothetical protein